WPPRHSSRRPRNQRPKRNDRNARDDHPKRRNALQSTHFGTPPRTCPSEWEPPWLRHRTIRPAVPGVPIVRDRPRTLIRAARRAEKSQGGLSRKPKDAARVVLSQPAAPAFLPI